MIASPETPFVAWSAVLLAAAVTFATQLLLGSSLFAFTVLCFDVETPVSLALASAIAFFVGGGLAASVSAGRPLHAFCHAMLTWTVATTTMLLLATSGTPGPLRTVASGPWAVTGDTPGLLVVLAMGALSAAFGAWPRTKRPSRKPL